MERYAQETLEIAMTAQVQEKFVEEVRRLLNSRALDQTNHSRGLLFGVAVENLADDWLRGERSTAEYRNLKRF